MDQDKEQGFALVLEFCGVVIAVCVSIALGMLVAPWLGFLSFAGFVFAFAAVLAVSYARSKGREPEGDGR